MYWLLINNLLYKCDNPVEFCYQKQNCNFCLLASLHDVHHYQLVIKSKQKYENLFKNGNSKTEIKTNMHDNMHLA